MSITSEDVNYLIYRYLCESGFVHSAFTFGAESLAAQSNPGTDVPTGGLIVYLQKGLQYREIETHLNTDNTCTEPFELLKNHNCSVKRELSASTPAAALDDATFGGVVPSSQLLKLEGHSGEVFLAAWNPVNPLSLVTGSGDSTARLWSLDRHDNRPLSSSTFRSTVLGRGAAGGDVTTLEWHPDGQLFSSGTSRDGCVRLWNANGDLVRELSEHGEHPVFRACFNRTGEYLLTGGLDKTTIVWDVQSGAVKQRFSVHQAPVLYVDWRDEVTFASCSQDQSIYVFTLGQNQPIASFRGHSDEVNMVTWSPDGSLLASCSDDLTAKLWKVEQPTPVHDLRTHTKEINKLEWSPTGRGSANPNMDLVLASGCADTSVKLWDPETGRERYTLTRHREPVYSVAFSPDGRFIASCSFDKTVNIWSVLDGSLVRSVSAESAIYDVRWNCDGTLLSACCVNAQCLLIDPKK